MLKGEQYAGGLALNFFESSEFEKEIEGETVENLAVQTRNLLRVLNTGWNNKWRSLLSWRTFNAVIIDRDHQLTLAMRLAFQQGFSHMFTQLEGKNLTPQEHNQAQLFISNCLTFLPFADMTPYESFTIPQYIENKWQMIDFKVTPIELTPTTGFKKLFIVDNDRVFAYGLEPIHHSKAEPHLIFMGTTYPAGQGFTTTVNTDLEAFETAGKKLYRTGHRNISRWLDKQLPKKTHVCGTSLGGALSLLIAIDQGNKISRVDALNPPGLYDPWCKSHFDHWDELVEKPEVYIQKQEGDPVSCFGSWKADWHVLQVIPPADKKGPNQVADHALNYAGLAETKFIGVDTLEDNEERKLRNLWLYTILRSITYYLIMVPIRYLILPPMRFIFNHKLQLALMLPMVVLFCVVPTLIVAVTTSIAINALLSATVASYWLTALLNFATDHMTNKKNSDVSMLLILLTKHPLLLIAVGLIAITTTAAFVACQLFSPPFIPLLILAVAAIPLIGHILNKIGSTVITLFGFNNVKLPNYQNPELPRNESLDIYNNTMEATFTYKEIGEYYQAKRCVLKGKFFLPDEALSSPKFFKKTGLTKREVLLKSQEPVEQEHQITFTATKAKIHDIQQTTKLIRQFGFQQEEKLRSALQKDRLDYVIGKPTLSAPL